MNFVNLNIKELKPSATLAINQKVILLREEGKRICHFGFGQSPFPIHHRIVQALQDNASNNNYLPTIGYEPLRKQVAVYLKEFQGIEVNSDYVYIGPGSKELLYQTILMLEGEYLIPKGSWVSYGPQIQTKKGSFTTLATRIENNFKLEPETLDSYCNLNDSKKKILILNSPNNPTGAVYSSKELEELSKVCRKHDIIVLSDEIYSQVNFNADYSPSIYKFYPEKTIVFGGLSKVFSAGGYRLGFMALPKDLEFLHTSYRALFSETFSAVSSPIQFAAVEAYTMHDDLKDYIKKCSEILKKVSDYVYNSLTELNISCTKPEGAFYMMIGFDNYKEQIRNLNIHSSEQLANYLLENYNVALLPASDFYFQDNELFFRLAFVDFKGDNALKMLNSLDNNESVFKECFSNIIEGINLIKKFIQEVA